MSREDKLVTFGFIAFIAFAIFGGVMGQRSRDDFRERCVAAGGVPSLAKYAWTCLRPETLVPLKPRKTGAQP